MELLLSFRSQYFSGRISRILMAVDLVIFFKYPKKKDPNSSYNYNSCIRLAT